MPLPIGLIFAALLFCGCTRSPSAASISQVAVARSNQEAKRIFNLEPFKQEDGQVRADGQQSVWEALTSSGGHDMTAKVTFSEKGSVLNVEVRMLAHPISESVTNFAPIPGREMQRERKQGIPEVMPK
jgi:hypothetical protein